MKSLLIFVAILATVAADCYMQNPRGSNDRNNEANTDRNNANRLFDSQNNAKGGYCRGPAMTFYTGSQVTVEWTAQHGCGRNPALMCNMVIQLMCSKTDADGMTLLRDGTTTNTIDDDAASPLQQDADGNFEFGMHESYDYYQMCKGRDRNFGLFIADRESEGGLNEGRRSAIYTRQNNNGDRHGYECTEERDYYPYWGPSPWMDVAVLAQNTDWCDFYKTESQNVKGRGVCIKPASDTSDDQEDSVYARYITESDCTSKGYTWTTYDSWGLSAPDCVQAPFTRENHLGNSFGGFPAQYNMTFPTVAPTDITDPSGSDCISDSNCNCALRIRYNISTSDASSDPENDFEEYANPISGFADFALNGRASPVTENPTVTLDGFLLKLAINTDQFGRTFQDRTHMFHIIPRPSDVPDTVRIHNLNVRGKRGNIVQTYPATEYNYIPDFLTVSQGDMIHFQWTGCDTNPAGNAGEGTDQTDRSNIVQLKQFAMSYPITDDFVSLHATDDVLMFPDVDTRGLFTYLGQTGCDPDNDDDNDENNCKKLNKASQYFDAGLIRANSTGDYYYMSSRNNNFSNRGQKGVLHINSIIPTWAIGVTVAGAAVFLGATTIGGLILYAKTHPHSSASNLVSRL